MLGMPRAEMLERMDSQEFTEWVAFLRLEHGVGKPKQSGADYLRKRAKR
jgi:hypothetical protein